MADALEARRANCNSFTDAANKFPRSPGEIGENISFTGSLQPKQSLSGAILVKTASSSALLVSPRKQHINKEDVGLEEASLQPHVRFIESQILAVPSPTKSITTKSPGNLREKPCKLCFRWDNTFPEFAIRFLLSICCRLMCDENSLKHLFSMESPLNSVIHKHCLFSILIGGAVYLCDAQLGIENHRCSQNTPCVDPRTREAAKCPR